MKKRTEKKRNFVGRTPEVIWRVFFWLWLIIGFLILIWTLYWYFKMITFQSLGVIAVAAIFASGVYMLAIYLGITVLILLILGVVKLVRLVQRTK